VVGNNLVITYPGCPYVAMCTFLFTHTYTHTYTQQTHSMWSLWMFTIPALRAKECMPKEKDALNVLFVLTPLLNVILPFVWKSFGFIFSADVVALLGVYYWKGAWMEVRRPWCLRV